MENGDLSSKMAFFILIMFCGPIVIVYLWCGIKWWLESKEKDALSNTYSKSQYIPSKTVYNMGNSKVKIPYNKPDRERPPNASFFSKMDGQDYSTEGPYEEEFLTMSESIKWGNKKRRETWAKERIDK